MKNLNRVALGLMLASVAVAPAVAPRAAMANVLTFDGDICSGPCSLAYAVDANYGSGVGVSVTYNHDISGAAPGNWLAWWSGGYSDLINVAFGGFTDAVGEPSITLTPLPGYSITLNGFDLGAWGASQATQATILAGGATVYSSGPIIVDPLTHTHIGGSYSSTAPITIQWGPSGYDVGIDNVDFTVAPVINVPEPATWAILLAGFGACVVLRRRDRSGA